MSLHLWIGWPFERAQTDSASAFDGVVLLGQVLSDSLVKIEQKAAVILALALLLRNGVELFVHPLNNLFELLLLEALTDYKLESWRFKRIPVNECNLQVRK